VSRLRRLTEGDLDVIRAQVHRAVDRYSDDIGFTAPELHAMRLQQLHERIDAAFDPDDGRPVGAEP
jgi:hypothetical protein